MHPRTRNPPSPPPPTLQYGINVDAVAKQMGIAIKSDGSKFMVNTGDNFYWCGLKNTSDFQIKADYLDPYGPVGLLDIPWYNVLGNHEYGYEVEVQMEMAKMYKTWIMDDRYYSRRVHIGNTNISFVFIDTSPCISEYRSSDPYGWDPCGTMYPTCSIKDPSDHHDQFEGPCEFNANILKQDCGVQYAWFKTTYVCVRAGGRAGGLAGVRVGRRAGWQACVRACVRVV